MKITATIKEIEGQLFIEFTGDMIDIVPVDKITFKDVPISTKGDILDELKFS
jgi:hypothetical protein